MFNVDNNNNIKVIIKKKKLYYGSLFMYLVNPIDILDSQPTQEVYHIHKILMYIIRDKF